MRTAYEIVRRIAETAMSRHGLDPRKLASAAGISEKSMANFCGTSLSGWTRSSI